MPTVMETEIDALRRMSTDELAEGDLSERARKRAEALADDAEVRLMAPKTLVCPPQNGESTTISRPLSNGERNDPQLGFSPEPCALAVMLRSLPPLPPVF